MNPSIVKRLLFSLSLLASFTSCVIKPDGEITVTTDNVTNITEDSADCGGKVSFTGGFTIGNCGVCYDVTSYPSYPKSFCTNDGWGTGSFASHLSGLKSGTKYYVRAYAITSSGIKYGNQQSFTTQEGSWFDYGSNSYSNYSWGLTNGGEVEWAVRFPPEILRSHGGKYITKFLTYVRYEKVYTLRVYQGGTTTPTKEIFSKAYNYSSTGWVTVTNFTPFSFDCNQSLWVSMSCTHDAGEYPMCTSKGILEPNARFWRPNRGSWRDHYTGKDDEDVCWLIRVQLSQTTKGGDGDVLGYGDDNID